MTVVVPGEHGLEEGERNAERDLGAIENEVKHLAETIAEHTTTLEGWKEDRNWITQRFEAVERDLAAVPRVPEELTSEFRETLKTLVDRLERMEAATVGEEETKPPHHDHEEEDRKGDDRDEHRHERRSLLDHLF